MGIPDAARSLAALTARSPVVVLAGTSVAGALVAGGAYAALSVLGSGLPTSEPSCSWPLSVRGKADADQVKLVRCYLKALAQRDRAGLHAVADNDPAVRITRRDLAHSADARAGLATATFRPSVVDGAYATVSIRYANGGRQELAVEIVNPQSAHSWRLEIGTDVDPGPPGPSPAMRSPR